ncbi:MAG TPA: hypothetical protein VNY36_08360 [Bacteroidia bacterium]|jgi:hypothetical protein|nr:hypothetical protein [Bacteroidia bacterium]
MKRSVIILFLLICICNSTAFCQSADTAQVVTIKVKRSTLPLRSLDSYSNTLYTNVSNILKVNYSDSTFSNYTIQADLAYIQDMKRGKFMIIKHNPGKLTVSVWKDSNGILAMVATQEFMVKPLPNASITIGENVIDTSASLNDLKQYGELNLVFGDFIPLDYMCTIKSFDLKIGKKEFHSESNKLTTQMLDALGSSETITFQNVMATINSIDDVTQGISADGKQRIVTQNVYCAENESKPIKLIK